MGLITDPEIKKIPGMVGGEPVSRIPDDGSTEKMNWSAQHFLALTQRLQ